MVIVAQYSKPQTEEQLDYHKQAEQHNICMVSPLPMQITGLAVGYYGTILRTTNGGTTWTITNKRNYKLIYVVFPLQMQITERLLG